MNTKIVLAAATVLICFSHLFPIETVIRDCRANIIYPESNADAKFWNDVVQNLFDKKNKNAFDCLPFNWRKAGNKKNLSILVCDPRLDYEEKNDPNKYKWCAGSGLGGIVVWSKAQYDKRKGICGCPEAAILHELIHISTNILDDYNDQIDSCIAIALKGICDNPGPGNCAKCEDENKNESPCKK